MILTRRLAVRIMHSINCHRQLIRAWSKERVTLRYSKSNYIITISDWNCIFDSASKRRECENTIWNVFLPDYRYLPDYLYSPDVKFDYTLMVSLFQDAILLFFSPFSLSLSHSISFSGKFIHREDYIFTCWVCAYDISLISCFFLAYNFGAIYAYLAYNCKRSSFV